MSFDVVKPGLLALLQDKGRQGFQHLGVTSGGPMDEQAFYLANKLLNNQPKAAQIEITFGMLSLRAHADCVVALTGADLGASINGEPIEPWHRYKLQSGDLLDFGSPVKGLRAYLAVVGGFIVEPTLGSCATVARENLGGLDGKGSKLRAGDILNFDQDAQLLSLDSLNWSIPNVMIPDYTKPLDLGVILGYQHESFSCVEMSKLFSTDYKVTQNIDRMGYRLSGSAIKSSLNGVISEGIACGAIQIPADGQPIVLMKDRQTIGGYPKVGCLTALGVGRLSQTGPGSVVRFHPIDIAQAEAERMLFNTALR